MKFLLPLIHDEGLRAVLLVAVGFLLAQLNTFFGERRERKKAVSFALANLLEVRHQYVGMEQLITEIGNIVGVNVPEHEKSQMRVIFDSMFPKWEELHSRYDQRVTTLATVLPLLAFQLRSKDFIRPILTFLHTHMGKDPQAAAVFGPILSSNLLSKVEPVLDESILALAIRKSPRCWYQTRRLLRKQKDVPNELQELLAPIKIAVEAQKQAATATQANAPKAPGTEVEL